MFKILIPDASDIYLLSDKALHKINAMRENIERKNGGVIWTFRDEDEDEVRMILDMEGLDYEIGH